MARKMSVDVVLPVYWRNLAELPRSIKILIRYFRKHLKDYSWEIVISVNGQHAEKILELSRELSKKYKEVSYLITPHAGKGMGVFHGWQHSTAEVRAYMDIDLATNLHSFRALIRAIEEGNDIAIGSRYHPRSQIRRHPIRWLISKAYIIFFYNLFLGVKVRDPQCGFKAVNERVVRNLVPLVEEKSGFFFESELLFHAYKKKYVIKEIPIVWREFDRSSVNMKKIIPNFMRNVWRLKKNERQKL